MLAAQPANGRPPVSCTGGTDVVDLNGVDHPFGIDVNGAQARAVWDDIVVERFSPVAACRTDLYLFHALASICLYWFAVNIPLPLALYCGLLHPVCPLYSGDPAAM